MLGTFEGVSWLLAAGLAGVTLIAAQRRDQTVTMRTVLVILLACAVLVGTFTAGAGAGALAMSRWKDREYIKLRTQYHKAMRNEDAIVAENTELKNKLAEAGL